VGILPDGAIKIEEINEKNFTYRISVNDVRMLPYHRANGITMIKVWNKSSQAYNKILIVNTGLLWAVDLFNKAYFKHFFKNVNIITGVSMMPAEIDTSDSMQRIINLCGTIFYPIAISLLMPLFMYTIVLEKESKLIEIMKINGMKMRYYWLSNFVFNFCLYGVTMILFYIIGGAALQFSMFTQSNGFLMVHYYVNI
jgi:hypothetical protein